jgi:hypothetical protein
MRGLCSQLAELFAGVGPVRKSFIVKDKGAPLRCLPVRAGRSC